MDFSNDETEEEFPRLPSTPVYMSIMETLKGKPIGLPLWNSFDIEFERRTMKNDTFSSTFISLARNLSEMVEDYEKDGKIMHIQLDKKTYNIFLPHPNDDVQIAFVVVFEDTDQILIEDKYKEELVLRIVNALKNMSEFLHFLHEKRISQIEKNDPLYNLIQNELSKVIIDWDKKHVKYLKQKAIEERKKMLAKLKLELEKTEQIRKEVEKSMNLGSYDDNYSK